MRCSAKISIYDSIIQQIQKISQKVSEGVLKNEELFAELEILMKQYTELKTKVRNSRFDDETDRH